MPNFASTKLLLEVVANQKQGMPKGIYSICSANPYVIQESLRFSQDHQQWVLIESTSNQVNQDGGYTGMAPGDFAAYISDMAQKQGVSKDQILLGGDHLGPNPWKAQAADKAMEKAGVLVREYIRAGYRKIHLDTSMKCGDDAPEKPLDLAVEAKRAAELCAIAEETWLSQKDNHAPLYVIGTEVPVPGGVESDDESIQITTPQSVLESLDVYEQTFNALGLNEAWKRVIAVVVQPGVEFSQFHIHDYDPSKAAALSQCIESVPGIIFEAHSTDYQKPNALRQMVADHFAILKVGPALTLALREAVFALAHIEKELLGIQNHSKLSLIQEILDQVMVENPQHWQSYYHGKQQELAIARKYSYSDRIRYYWPDQRVSDALSILIRNLNLTIIPLVLIKQFLPNQYERIREGKIRSDPESLILDSIRLVLNDYLYACQN